VVYELIIVLQWIFKKKKYCEQVGWNRSIREGTVVESCERFKNTCVRKVRGKVLILSVVFPKS